MDWARELVRRSAARLGFRITRSVAANRFQAMDGCLTQMERVGYRPEVVVDCGANLGQFFHLAHPVFPEASYHLIEPQEDCARALERLSRHYANVELHRVAVTEPGAASVTMAGGGTGAWVTHQDEVGARAVPASTLDELLAGQLRREQRALLKLDVESHELSALKGAVAVLESVEAVLLEVSFYDFGRQGRPLFADLLDYLRAARFELYDFASLSGRPRDQRLWMGDVVCVRKDSPLLEDCD